MPLPPLPPNNTARYWFRYVTGVAATSQTHEVMVRVSNPEATDDNVSAALLSVLNAIGAATFRQGWKVIAARKSPAGAVFSIPVQPSAALLAFLGTESSGLYNQRWEANEDSMQGRSLTTGRRVDFSLYRAAGDVFPNFRFGMSGALTTALSVAAGGGYFACIDGTAPSWYTYVNQNYNSYWERQLRV